jgi:hypothetical protein
MDNRLCISTCAFKREQGGILTVSHCAQHQKTMKDLCDLVGELRSEWSFVRAPDFALACFYREAKVFYGLDIERPYDIEELWSSSHNHVINISTYGNAAMRFLNTCLPAAQEKCVQNFTQKNAENGSGEALTLKNSFHSLKTTSLCISL